MDENTLREWFDQPNLLRDRFTSWGLREPAYAVEQFQGLAELLPWDLLPAFFLQLETAVEGSPAPDLACNGLFRFLQAARSPLAMLSLFERDRASLPMLLQVFATGPRWTQLLLRDPEAFDFLRLTEGMPSSREELQADVQRETSLLTDERTLTIALGRIREREQFRIGYGELYRHVRLEIAMRQLSDLAEVLIAAALQFATSQALETMPATVPAPRLAVIALGRLGSGEQDYGSPLQLLFVGENLPSANLRRNQPQELLEKIARQTVRILQEESPADPVYGISFPLIAGESRETLVRSLDEILTYCDAKGRTWERSLMLASRPIAGDMELAGELVKRLQPWLYRRYLNRADETGLRALKRRMQQRSSAAAVDDCQQGPGGILAMEEVVRFLQLLNGGELEIVRRAGTLSGIAGLEQGEVLSVEERSVLEQGYEKLRQWEHRGQLLSSDQPAEILQERLHQQAETIAHLFDSAFGGDAAITPITELILDPAPSTEKISSVLRGYGFQNVTTAYTELDTLAVERIPFLSTRRSRHFLAEIAPTLLTSIAAAPDPDFTLINLVRVSDSLGGKGVLWELFQQQPAWQELYVRLCGGSLYLSELLTSNPGMIDDLLDSLHLSLLPSVEELEALVADLFPQGAAEAAPGALANFRQAQHLRIGVREMLGLEDVAATHQALAAVAEVCVRQIVESEYKRLAAKYGEPGTPAGDRCEWVVLALGKLGGNEPNYHSPLELAFIYEVDGMTQPPLRSRSVTSTTNTYFFAQLTQRILKSLTEMSPRGRLYEVQTPIRPQGRTGPIAVSLPEFRNYLQSDRTSPVELQGLVKARAIVGSKHARAAVENAIVEALLAHPWQPGYAEQIRLYRQQQAEGATGRNLKKAPGGTGDVEAVVHVLQWQHANVPGMIGLGTLAAIERLCERNWLSADDAEHWSSSYRFLRGVESALRLMNVPARHDLPTTSVDWRRLSMVLQHQAPPELAEQLQAVMAENHLRFERFFSTDL